jgi:allantoate deiminase
MNHRRDALVAAAMFVQSVEDYAAVKAGLVATVGQLTVLPGAANVVPGEVSLSLDIRHADDSERLLATQWLIDTAGEIANQRRIELTTRHISENSTVPCSPHLSKVLAEAIEELGHPVTRLASGAGHDAVVMAGLTDIAMLFVRCKGGVSHNPAESVAEADVADAIDVLGGFMERLTAQP